MIMRPDKSEIDWIFFLIFTQNVCCGSSKEPYQRDGSLKHTEHTFKLMGENIYNFMLQNLSYKDL